MTTDAAISLGESYHYFLVDLLTDNLIAELPFTDVSWSQKVSAAGEFTGTIPVLDNSDLDLYWATIPGKIGVYVMRGSAAVFGGPIWSRDYDMSTKSLSVQAGSWESYLFRRHIWHNVSYSNQVDQYDVVRDLINLMQSDFSAVAVATDIVLPYPAAAGTKIDLDTRMSGKTQDTQTWLGTELRSFGEALVEFSNNLNGFEWNIEVAWDETLQRFTRKLVFRDTPPAQLPTGIEYAGERPGLDRNIFEHPGNIINITLAETADEAATRYYVVGGAPEGLTVGEEFKPRGVWNNDVFLAADWPLIEAIDSSRHPNVAGQATLDGYAKVYGQRARPPVPTWTVTVNGDMDPTIGSYKAGDWCQIVTNEDKFILSRIAQSAHRPEDDPTGTGLIKRIMGFSVEVPTVSQFNETVTLELADEWTVTNA